MTKQHQDNQVLGMSHQEYDQSASAYSKGVITFWLIAGLAFNLLTGNFISLSSALLVFPGIFVISIASMPLFYLKVKKVRAIQAMNERDNILILGSGKRAKPIKDVPQLMFYTLTSALDFLFPIATAVLAMYLLNN